MLVDSHCHLDFPDFAPELDATVARARAAGIGRMVTIGTHLTKARPVIEIAERFDGVMATVGLHPHHAVDELDLATVENIAALADHPKVIAIGETGLDYFYDHSPRETQRESFRRHIRAALQLGLPVIVHTRDAEDDTMQILTEEGAGKGLTGLIHCFSSSRQLAEKALEIGFSLSFSGIVTFKKSEELRAIARDVPLERMLVETDAPYLAPVPHRGKRNEPAFVAHTAAVLADLKGVTPEAFAEATTANFRALFPKAV
jgi:TatD DNase family protein